MEEQKVEEKLAATPKSPMKSHGRRRPSRMVKSAWKAAGRPDSLKKWARRKDFGKVWFANKKELG